MIEEVESVFYECLIQLLFEKFEEVRGCFQKERFYRKYGFTKHLI